MRGKESGIILIVIVLLSAVLLSCGSKGEEPIYNPEPDKGRYSGDTGGLYNVEGNAPPPDTSSEEKYESPWGPKYPKEIQWAPSLRDAINRCQSGSGKKVLVWFVSRDCEDCDRIERDVFSSEEVLKQADKYIWYKFDVDSDPEMAKYYIQEHKPPVMKWLDGDGNGYHTLYGGFDDPKLLAAHLRDKH